MRMTKFLAGALLAGTVATSSPMAEYKPLNGDPKELNFGIISTESVAHLKEQWLPLMAIMEEQLGMKVNAFFAPDYAGVIEAMRFGKVHLAWFGNKSGMEAVDRAGGEVFVQTSKKGGKQGYYSHIITHVDNKHINSLKDIFACDKSLNFGIGDPNSTSGFLVPTYYVFAQNKVDPKACFKTVRNANHETNLMAVAHKQVHIAANNSEQIARSKKKAPQAADKIKVIWTSPLIPSDPLVYRTDLSKEMKSRIKGFFLAFGRYGDTARAHRILASISDGLGFFMESSNAQLHPIRQLSLYKDRLKVLGSSLSQTDKDKKAQAIDDQLAALAQVVQARNLY